MNRFEGLPYQKGYGLGGTFRKFFKWVVPLVKKHALPVIHDVGKKALDTAADIAKDYVSGKPISTAAEDRINTSVEDLKKLIESKLEGRGRKRKILIKNKKGKKFNHLEKFFQK